MRGDAMAMTLALRLAALEGRYGHRRPVVLPPASAADDPAIHAAETAYIAALNYGRTLVLSHT